jgi:hypothetical protein
MTQFRNCVMLVLRTSELEIYVDLGYLRAINFSGGTLSEIRNFVDFRLQNASGCGNTLCSATLRGLSKLKVLFHPTLPDFRKSITFWKVPRLLPFVRLVSTTCRWSWGRSSGGMVLTGETRSAGRKNCLSANLSTTDLTGTGLGSNPHLRGDRPATNRFEDST